MSVRRSSGARQPPASPSRDDMDELNSAATPLQSASRRSSIATPYTRLRQLAGAIHKPSTPLARARTPSIGPVSGRRGERTPASSSRTPALSRLGRPASSATRLTKPTTPHVIRALQQRKAAAASTPGRQERRRSGRQARETPRDILRQLSRLENKPAVSNPTPRQVPVPPRSSETRRRTTDFDISDSDDEDQPQPNLTVPIDDETDSDDSFQAPPRLSQAFENDDGTTQMSIEGPRRDFAGLGRRPSEGLRVSDRFGDISGIEEQVRNAIDEDEDDSMAIDGFGDGLDDVDDDDPADPSGMLTTGRASLAQDATLGLGDAENSFAFQLPADLTETNLQDDPNMDPISDSESGLEEPLPEAIGSASDKAKASKHKPSKALKHSRYGIAYPSLPPSVVKKLTAAALRSSGRSKTRVDAQILAAVMQASDWFFEQLGEDLEAYANHAKRKTIDESDVITLMRRQRVLNASTTPFSLAQKQLPRELLQDLRMVQPGKKIRKNRRLATIAEE